MKVVLLKSNKKAHGADPIAQCGGVILRDGETLAIRADLALAVRRAHPALQEVGTEDVGSLRSGIYEVRAVDRPESERKEGESVPAQNAPASEPVQERAADRSMAGVGKGKKKHK